MKTEKEKFWSQYAENFDELNNYVVGKSDVDRIKSRLSEIKNLGKMLEIACGNGTYTRVMLDNAQHITATDFSEEMVKVTIKNLVKYKNIKVEKANCFELPYDDETFDTVFMANLLHVIPTPEKALTEAKRVVKQGGQIIALDYTSTGMNEIDKSKMMQRYMEAYGDRPKSAINVDDKIMNNLFTSNGLDVKFTKLIGGASKAAFGKATKPQVKR